MEAFIGLITVCDALEANGPADPAIIAVGLKATLLSHLFELFTYSISNFTILILRIVQR